jgi:hypothetical protein
MTAGTYTCQHEDMARPATGTTTNRNVRVADDPWEPALDAAKLGGAPLSVSIVAFLEAFKHLPPGLWLAAHRKAVSEGRTLADVIGPTLRRYVETERPRTPIP